jgi:uncharacterized protein YhfF
MAGGDTTSREGGHIPLVRLGVDLFAAEHLAGLVARHEKWATSFPLGAWPIPAVGTVFDIEAPGSGLRVRVSVAAVGVCRMSAVGPDFAAAEGCGSVAEWHRVHAEFYHSVGVESPDPLIVQLWLRRHDP